MLNPVILISLVPVGIAAFMVFDKLVRLEYLFYRKNWLADGKPHGFFWVPNEAKSAGGSMASFGSSFAFQRCAFKWLFWTPEWMRRDDRALRLVFWLRVLTLIWNLGIGGFVIARSLL
jgi:hypothetical protein